MKALITGASSGIGRDMARELAAAGYDLVLVARREDRLRSLADSLPVACDIIAMDISGRDAATALYKRAGDVDILVNNAGFGNFGFFTDTDLERDIDMIDLNITSLHVLTKLYLADFIKKNSGIILNVASSAAFSPGPLMAEYYASKAYVMRLSQALSEELRRSGSAAKVCVLCPGPVKTEFDSVADVRFSLKGLSSEYVAKYAIKKALAGKKVIVPGFGMKALRVLSRLVPDPLLVRVAYNMQKKKGA